MQRISIVLHCQSFSSVFDYKKEQPRPEASRGCKIRVNVWSETHAGVSLTLRKHGRQRLNLIDRELLNSLTALFGPRYCSLIL